MFIQEVYIDDPWKLLMCCIFLNQTNRKQLDKVRIQFFEKYPTPQSVIDGDHDEIVEIIKPLGFYNRRTKTIKRFSKEYLGDWEDVNELHGIGKYASDSYQIFIKQNFDIEPEDGALNKFMYWYKKIK
jgi:endonuclease III